MHLRKVLGLEDIMSTYFLRAPQEYWQALGTKPQPYDDNVGEYDFIHAFFETIEDFDNYGEILLSKISAQGILWISFPKKIKYQDLEKTLKSLDLQSTKEIEVTTNWNAFKVEPSRAI